MALIKKNKFNNIPPKYLLTLILYNNIDFDHLFVDS